MRSATGREVASSSAAHSNCASTACKYSKSAPLSTTAGARFFVKTVKSKTMRKLTWCHGSAKSSTERVVLSNVRTHDKPRQPNDETLCTRTLTNHRPTGDVTPKPVTTDQGLHSHEQRRPATDETNLLDTAHHTFTQILTISVEEKPVQASAPRSRNSSAQRKPTSPHPTMTAAWPARGFGKQPAPCKRASSCFHNIAAGRRCFTVALRMTSSGIPLHSRVPTLPSATVLVVLGPHSHHTQPCCVGCGC